MKKEQGSPHVSIVAAAHSPFGKLSDKNLEALIVDVTRDLLKDAKVAASDIDAIFLGNFNSGMVPDTFAASLVLQADPGFRFKPAVRCENACASGSAAVQAGINAIRPGQADLVLVVGAEKMTSNSTPEVTKALAGAGYKNDPLEAELSFPQLFGVAATQYTKRYQDPLAAMARIAAKNHKNAVSNPLAQIQKDFGFEHCNTVSDKNPLIAPPLRLTDCSLITDGAAAILLASEERAREFSREVAICSTASPSDYLPFSKRDILAFDGPALAIRTALKKANLHLSDLDFAEVHDCFTIAELLIYEAMGLTDPGQGARALEEGTVFPDGSLPVNLSGGLKAKGHPVGATGVSMHALAFRQLTRNAIGIALAAPEFGLVFNMGGLAVANHASVLQAKRY